VTTYDWTVTIDGVDVSQWVKAAGTIDYGRPSRFAGFQAPMAVFDMFTQDENPSPAPVTWPTVDLGDPVIIHVTWDGVTQWRRFTGVVQALDWSTSGLRVTAAGTSADWQTLTASGLEFTLSPIADSVSDELDTARVDRLCDDAGVSITIEGVPARRVRGIPAGSLAQPLLDALLRIADDCDGLLMEDRLGVVRYRTRNFDRPAPYTLPSTVVERDTIDMAYERGTHVNAVRVFYGEPDANTGQQNYKYVNDTGVYDTVSDGERLVELYSDLAYERAAEGRGTVYIEKNRLAWEVPDVTLVMSLATGAEADDILDLQQNWMVTLDDLPAGCPIASYDGDILGITDIMHETDYRIVLHLGPRIADTGATPEEPIFAEDSITGGTETTYEDGNGFLWQIHTWATPGDYTATVNNDVTCEVLVVGGGGGGGNQGSSRAGGGGGAGALLATELAFTPGTIPVTVGSGGGASTAGGTSKLAEAWCYGGGDGGDAQASGNAGGCGGGGGQNNPGPSAAGGAALYGSLDAGVTTNSTLILGDPGDASPGGASGAGGGISYASSITGTAVTYSAAGAGNNSGGANPGASGSTPGSGGQGAAPSGSPGSGANGVVVVRYRIG
jgi:hypothetical protein